MNVMAIPLLPCGRTGHQSTRIIFGGAALSRVSQDVAYRTLDVLLEHGINHLDVAASYGDAELRGAPWLKRYPDRFFAVKATCQERNAAVQTIKSLAYRPWSGRERTATTWYQPLEDQADIDPAVHWALGEPGIFVISTGDVNVLPKVLEAAERIERRPADAELERMVERLQMEPLFV